jgi:hypothetical protein
MAVMDDACRERLAVFSVFKLTLDFEDERTGFDERISSPGWAAASFAAAGN